MEDALVRLANINNRRYHVVVLILVLMEDALVQQGLVLHVWR